MTLPFKTCGDAFLVIGEGSKSRFPVIRYFSARCCGIIHYVVYANSDEDL